MWRVTGHKGKAEVRLSTYCLKLTAFGGETCKAERLIVRQTWSITLEARYISIRPFRCLQADEGAGDNTSLWVTRGSRTEQEAGQH